MYINKERMTFELFLVSVSIGMYIMGILTFGGINFFNIVIPGVFGAFAIIELPICFKTEQEIKKIESD